jgi:DNA damage-binding protein 1
MVELYSKRGMDENDARAVVDILSKNHEHFVDVMMVEELGILPPNPEESQAKMGALTP